MLKYSNRVRIYFLCVGLFHQVVIAGQNALQFMLNFLGDLEMFQLVNIIVISGGFSTWLQFPGLRLELLPDLIVVSLAVSRQLDGIVLDLGHDHRVGLVIFATKNKDAELHKPVTNDDLTLNPVSRAWQS